MTRNNMRRMGADFWGSPAATPQATPDASKTDTPPVQTDGGAAQSPAGQTEEVPPPESMEDLQKELDGYIGLEAVKKEVRSLIDLVKVHKMRR